MHDLLWFTILGFWGLFALVLAWLVIIWLLGATALAAAGIAAWAPRFYANLRAGDRVTLAWTLSALIFFGPLVAAVIITGRY